MKYELINDNASLSSLCFLACKQKIVTLDTEFIRTRTYYPKLGLIQLYFGDVVTLIDPLSITDWQPFIDLLINPDVLKIFHASSEDLDVLKHEFNTMPTPLLDTQIVASFLGHPLSSGFASLVSDYLSIELDKSEARTDWLARPLAQKQLTYAAADVFYLLPLAKKLMQDAEDKGWFEASKEETLHLVQKKQKIIDSELAYLSISQAWQLSGIHLACLKKLAKWRLEYAIKHDFALNFVVHEESLLLIAKHLPHSLFQLSQLNLKANEIRLHGQSLLNIVSNIKDEPQSSWPKDIERVFNLPDYKKNMKAIKSIIVLIAEKISLRPELIASKRQIEQLLQWINTNDQEIPDLLKGWRKQLIGNQLDFLVNHKNLSH